MQLTFTTTSREARLQGVKVLVYGQMGIGKTRLCATAPKPLILSAEAGLLSLADVEIPVVKISSLDELKEVYRLISTGDRRFGQFQTICLDSFSEIGEVVLSAAKTTVKDVRQAYGMLMDEITAIAKKFRDLPGINVYFSCKEDVLKDTSANTVSYRPDMPGQQLGKDLPYFYDEVFAFVEARDPITGGRKPMLRTRSDFQYRAKDRSGALLELEEPNLTVIFEKIRSRQLKAARPAAEG